MDSYIEDVNNIDPELLPELDEKMSKAMRGRVMRQYWTVVNKKVVACGHDFNPSNSKPRTNCEHCWIAFFMVHGDITALADEIYRDKGRKALIAIRGKKFTVMFIRFMAGMALLKKQEEEKNEQKDLSFLYADQPSEVSGVSGSGEATEQGIPNNQPPSKDGG